MHWVIKEYLNSLADKLLPWSYFQAVDSLLHRHIATVEKLPHLLDVPSEVCVLAAVAAVCCHCTPWLSYYTMEQTWKYICLGLLQGISVNEVIIAKIWNTVQYLNHN